MARYKVWNKTDDVITPIGEVLSAAEWIERYPVAKVLDTVCGGGTINGAYFGVYDQMKQMYEDEGCDFTNCTTQQEVLDAIEVFEDDRNTQTVISTDERIASALEAQLLLQMDDIEEDEEDTTTEA